MKRYDIYKPWRLFVSQWKTFLISLQGFIEYLGLLTIDFKTDKFVFLL